MSSPLLLPSSNGPRVDRVVLRMRTYEPNVHGVRYVPDPYHQPVLVATDVEHDPVPGQHASRAVLRLDVRRVAPLGAAHLTKPRLQRLPGVQVPRVALPELT